MSADSEEELDQDIEVSGSSSRYPSPVPSPASVNTIPGSKDKESTVKYVF